MIAACAAGSIRAGAIQVAVPTFPKPSEDRCDRSCWRRLRIDSGTEKFTMHQPSVSVAGCRACQMISSPRAKDSAASGVSA